MDTRAADDGPEPLQLRRQLHLGVLASQPGRRGLFCPHLQLQSVAVVVAVQLVIRPRPRLSPRPESRQDEEAEADGLAASRQGRLHPRQARQLGLRLSASEGRAPRDRI